MYTLRIGPTTNVISYFGYFCNTNTNFQRDYLLLNVFKKNVLKWNFSLLQSRIQKANGCDHLN